MRRNIHRRLIGGLIVGALMTPVGWAQSKPELQLHANLIFPTNGRVEILRAGWKVTVAATFGSVIDEKDKIILKGPAEASVVCSDLTVRHLNHSIELRPCAPLPQAPARKLGEAQIDIRGGPLTLLAPRQTSIALWLDKQLGPLLASDRELNFLMVRWSPVVGISEYGVLIHGPAVRERKLVAKTQLEYPLRRLEPGRYYLKIFDPRGNFPGDDTQFQVLSGDETLALQRATRKIARLEAVDATVRQFLLASLFADTQVFVTASEIFEHLGRAIREPVVSRAAGEVYLSVGLTSSAEASLKDSLALSLDRGDTEGEALTSRLLGRFYSKAKYEPTSAARYFETAEKKYCFEFGAGAECNNVRAETVQAKPR